MFGGKEKEGMQKNYENLDINQRSFSLNAKALNRPHLMSLMPRRGPSIASWPLTVAYGIGSFDYTAGELFSFSWVRLIRNFTMYCLYPSDPIIRCVGTPGEGSQWIASHPWRMPAKQRNPRPGAALEGRRVGKLNLI